jgi:hypothetical protein
MASSSFVQKVLAGFADALQPLRDAVASPAAFASFLQQFGWTLTSTSVTELTTLLQGLATLATNPTSLALEQLTSDLVQVATLVRKIASSSAPTAFTSTFPRELLDYLVYNAAATKVPPLFGILHFAGIFSEHYVAADSATGRSTYLAVQVDWDRLGPLADQPLQTMQSAYGWGGTFDGDALIRSIGMLVRGLGGPAGIFDADRALRDEYYLPGSSSASGVRHVVIPVPGLDPQPSTSSSPVVVKLAVMAMPIPPNATAAAAPDGLVVMPMVAGQAGTSINLTSALTLTLAGDVLSRPVRAELHPGSAVLRATPGDTTVNTTARVNATAPSTGPWIPIGDATTSRLELSKAHVAFGLDGTVDGDMELTAELGFDSADLVIDFSEGDSLMQDTVSSQPTKSALSFTIKWSSKTGFALGGQPKLAITIPVQESLAGVATLQAIAFALGASTGGRLEFDAMLTGSTSIGPAQLEVQNVGLAVYIIPSPDTSPPGALGNIDFGFGFKSPSGVGVAIDTAGLTGGGFLSHNEAASQYAGMLQLSYQAFQLQAFGLITTKLPTGPGYSMVAMVDATFPPIALVAGFTLNGVGGLLGINRTVSTDALEAGIKAKTLSSFLFTKNPVANAPQLLTDLATFFPAAQGRYVFGPLLQIGWGTPTVITIDLALLLELPDPVRLVLIGELAVLLPNPNAVLLEMHMDVLGTVDFGTDEGSLDAVLHNSKLVQFALQGSMAFRSCWSGSDKTFLLSVGGFHPKFQPPPGFPTLQRVSISMPSGHITKLNLDGYFAVSSNTLQIGAHVDLFVGVDGFGIAGYLNFDTLIQWNPFYFDGDISGGVTLSADGDNVMSLDLSADLTGPAPWHCAGKVHFSVLGFGVTKHFSATFGSSAPAQSTDLIDVGAQVRAALSDPRNFTATLTANQNGLVSLLTPATQGVAVGHPAAGLKVMQRVVPLGLTIQKFGAGAPSGDTQFTITAVTADGTDENTTPVQDAFAPAQFLNMSDDDKLANPSFETFDAGISLADGALTFGNANPSGMSALVRMVSYETWLVDTPGGDTREDPGIPVPPDRFSGILWPLLNSGRLRYSAPSQPMAKAATLDYVVATTDQIAASGVGVATGQTYAQAHAALTEAIAGNPAQSGTLQVVALYEVTSG